jgi:hypothetical protein
MKKKYSKKNTLFNSLNYWIENFTLANGLHRSNLVLTINQSGESELINQLDSDDLSNFFGLDVFRDNLLDNGHFVLGKK